ncbi:calcium-binding protein 39-like isoform X2 [Clavelina lepadiformis]|uniref:calcium-binding protein 39-like isoform X2 n=1 Tax=Clavelina lepadiformis TaxID=159417 RepID=UPI00404234E8
MEKAQQALTENLVMMKLILCGSEQPQPQPELVAQISQEVYNTYFLVNIVDNISYVDLELQTGDKHETVDHLINEDEIVIKLVKGYESPDIALFCGKLLRECIRHEPLAIIFFERDLIFKFFEYVEMSDSDIASDAFKDLLTRHQASCFKFLSANFDRVFQAYNRLLESENCLLRCQSLKLLGELFLIRHNLTIMTRYIGKPENLNIMMNNLRDQSRNIQFEAFHVFKVFVANPNKTKPIFDILLKNQQKLVDFLSNFHNDRSDDQQFNYEKDCLIEQIKELSG